MMFHPDNNIIYDIEEVTSDMISPSENMTESSAMAVPLLNSSMGYFSQLIF